MSSNSGNGNLICGNLNAVISKINDTGNNILVFVLIWTCLNWYGLANKCNRDASLIKLGAVSKFKSVDDIRACYNGGQRIFGENYVQELTEKAPQLPADIEW